MKKTILSILIALIFTVPAFAGIFGIKSVTPGKAELVLFNDDLAVSTIATIHIQGTVVSNSFFQSADKGIAGFVTSFQNQKELVIVNLEGEIQNTFHLGSRTMGFTFLPDVDGLGFIQSNQNFNPYGNNDEDISFVIFDIEQGFTRSTITLDQFAFDPTDLPFKGKNGGMDNSNQPKHTNVSISAPFYNSSKGRVEFFATDVMGNQRHMMIDVLRNSVISDKVVFNHIVAATPVSDRLYKVVTAETDDGKTNMYVSDYNVQNGLLINKVLVEVHNDIHSNPGVLVMNDSKTHFYYQGTSQSSTRLIPLDPETNEAVQSAVLTGRTSFNYPVSKDALYDKLGSVKVFPNPTTDYVTVSNDYGVITKLEVLSIHGQEVLVVEAGADVEVNEFQADLSNLAPGTYFIRSYIGSEVYVSKVGVQ